MSRTVIEVIPAELVRDGKTYNVRLRLTVKELEVNESISPVARTIARYELVPVSGTAIADSPYTLRYVFNGKQEEDSVRVQGGTLLAG